MLLAGDILYLDLPDGTICPVRFLDIKECEIRKFRFDDLEVTLTTKDGQRVIGKAKNHEYGTLTDEIFNDSQWSIRKFNVESCDFYQTFVSRRPLASAMRRMSI